MSCWVVPSVAAELWGMPVAHVLDAMRAGRIPTRSELGFTLVDVAPNGPQMAAPPPVERPRAVTFTEARRVTRGTPPPQLIPAEVDGPVDEEQFDWRQARRETALLRRRPMAVAA